MEIPIDIPYKFIEHMPSLSTSAIRLFIYFRYLREMSRKKYPNEYAWIRCSQKTILSNSGIKSKTSLRSGLVELATHGWLIEYMRGGYSKAHGNTTNRYCVGDEPLERPNPELIKKLGGTIDETEPMPRVIKQILKSLESEFGG